MPFRIYYADGSVAEGSNRNNWRNASSTGVQVVIRWPRENGTRWFYTDANGKNHAISDRDMWTGEDVYDPFGWGIKLGSLLPDEQYQSIWNRAGGDSNT
jgi:hypothetical protein